MRSESVVMAAQYTPPISPQRAQRTQSFPGHRTPPKKTPYPSAPSALSAVNPSPVPRPPLGQHHHVPAGVAGLPQEVLRGAEAQPEDLLALDRLQVVEEGEVRVRVVG